MDTFTLNGREWHFRVPALPIQIDLMLALQHNKPRVAACAINLCLVDEDGDAPFDGSYLACGCNPLVYGGLIMQHLHEADIPLGAWYAIGLEVLDKVAEAYSPPTQAEVSAAEDFSEAPMEDGPDSGQPSP